MTAAETRMDVANWASGSSLTPDLQQRLARAERLLDLGSALSATRSLDETLACLVEGTRSAVAAERASLFLADAATGELVGRFTQGTVARELRFPVSEGIAGHVYRTGQGMIVDDAYGDARFSPRIDAQTGFVTQSILCAPILARDGSALGVIECLNKQSSTFTAEDLELVMAMGTQAVVALHSGQVIETLTQAHLIELEFLDTVAALTSEIDLTALLRKVMREATRMLRAERSTLFLNDPASQELWSRVGDGLDAIEIRMPNTSGGAGHAFVSGEIVNIAHAYADLRFNPSFDLQTGFFTRSILCVPIVNQTGTTMGVAQVLNKIGGPFTREDEQRLKAFSAQVAIALENAKLFNDMQSMKNYNDSVLQSMSNAVLTLDADHCVVTCNAAGARLIKRRGSDVLGAAADRVFGEANAWVLDKVARVAATDHADVTMGADLHFGSQTLSVNLTVLPLRGADAATIGTMIVVDDITNEKRLKSTMARYIDPQLADRLLETDSDLLGGRSLPATILFADIRGFTALTESLGPQGTVALLNDYFTLMVDCVQQAGGMLDKFIGDALMAVFGVPVARGDDEDRAIRAAIRMHRQLAAWNGRRLQNGLVPVAIGIGINTDEVVSGNIGSPRRMDYTVIGDGVNLAARLESTSKVYNTPILISENTRRRLNGTYRIRPVDIVTVHGRAAPVEVHEILDHHDADTFPHLDALIVRFRRGIDAYRAHMFSEALDHFQAALTLNDQDRLSVIYRNRCRELIQRPPSAEWSGVTTLTGK